MDSDAKDELAESLYEALHSGSPIDRPTDTHDMTIADAYDVQTRFVDRRLADGATVVGHKIGLTSDAIQTQLGVDEPDFGRLLDTMFVDGRTVPTENLLAPRVEPEIGFVMDEALEPPVTHLDVLNATRAVFPVIEVIDSRVRDWNIGIEDTIADNASSALYVVGERTADPTGVDLSLEGTKLHLNGRLEASGVGAAVLDHPARSVAWLANAIDEMDQRLDAGHVVLSGSLTPAVDVAPGDDVAVEFTSLGTINARFGPADD